jgi:hypothetical protein
MTDQAREWEEGGRLDFCAFVGRLSDKRLEWLIADPALGSDILQHAAECEVCGKRVDDVVRQSFQNLPPEEKWLYEQMAKESLDRSQEPIRLEVVQDISQQIPERVLRLAAADSDKIAPDREIVMFTLPSTGGESIVFVEEADGRLLVQTNSFPEARALRLGLSEFPLDRTDSPGTFALRGVGLVEIAGLVQGIQESGDELTVSVV